MTRIQSTMVIAIVVCSVPALAGGDPQNIAINEVFYGGNASEDWVELINRGDQSVDIASWRLCSRFTYPTIDESDILSGNPDLTIEPGEIIALAATIDLADAADLGLYVSSPFGDPANMVDFLQWGTSSDVGRSDVARDKGIWLEPEPGEFDFVPQAAPSESTAWCGTESGGGFLTTSMDFRNGSPTQGSANNLNCDLVFMDGFEAPSRGA